jgi:hypothetical protein
MVFIATLVITISKSLKFNEIYPQKYEVSYKDIGIKKASIRDAFGSKKVQYYFNNSIF